MLKSLQKSFFSIKSAVIMMFIFAVSIGIATFIENDYGTQTAWALVYTAKWFEILLVLLSLNLLYNIFRFRLFRKDKFFTGLFHLAFIVIIIGAAVTRYFGYEGTMHIREGSQSNTILSARTYLQIEAKKGKNFYSYAEPIYLSKIGSNTYKRKIAIGDEKIEVELLRYIPNATYTIVADKNGKATVKLVFSAGGGRVEKILQKGQSVDIGDAVITFDKEIKINKPVITITQKEGKLYIKAPFHIKRMVMGSMQEENFAPSEDVPFEKGHLYAIAGLNIVLKNFQPHAKVELQSKNPLAKNSPHDDALILRVKSTKGEKIVTLFGKSGREGEPVHVKLGDLELTLSYGARRIQLPFALKLRDFQLERYPGSMSPSSYASEVTVVDGNKSFDYRIYMNHVLDYKGYRFFQSSYDMDEKGTILSVNHDPGTLITYIGYLLLAVGMLLHFFMPQSRFQKLARLTKRVQEQRESMLLKNFALIAFLILGMSGYAADNPLEVAKKISKTHADKFGEKILVQDNSGRIEPIDTLSRKVLAKIARKEELYGLDANQFFLGMTVKPEIFQKIKMIYVHHPAIKKIIGLNPNEKYATFNDFFDMSKDGAYKLLQYVQKATAKKPGARDQFDKDVIKVDERVNVAYMVYTGALLRIIPNNKDKNRKWVTPIEAMKSFAPKEAELVRLIMASYFQNVENGIKTGDWSKADKSLDVIADYQKYYGSDLIPPKSKIKAELLYNKLDIFNRLVPYYMLIGFILLILILINLINPRFNIKWIVRVGVVLIFLGFMAQTFGMALRWYVAGHAPWSNGYESMVYISWATIFAGFFFAKKSPIAFAATSLLGGLILFVAHLNWLDPQITNLVPVLKSYWLMIHVSVITASYGFLGLSALLAFVVLILFIFVNENNKDLMELTFKELTYINEMSLIIGLVLVTLGNFLGGVWANESWGRYWGWDPKETWAAVTILVYACIEHVRLIPKMNKLFLYNVLALLGYSSVIMTYFGVNFYLSGLHSYAQGDPVPIPQWVYWAIGIIFAIIAAAYYKKQKYNIDIRI
ncbi:cytochrome c biogenesis protein [Nitratiruptor tergarcus]|uniref:Cytochrome c-type biogenesis protein CcsB n=1 Tax=Nitratiruptor tergarcus DSM 16512 TaxID=1069081 RepID=A0A1W1WUE0_9BACT|nr:cytochrome c biogenesis protein CcsA [Nitratiruptor tergarcus]SMC09353.1 cytochrome c-type biogenesis protein CcsB [Nitratiruptor tergarcus DSM 16512]